MCGGDKYLWGLIILILSSCSSLKSLKSLHEYKRESTSHDSSAEFFELVFYFEDLLEGEGPAQQLSALRHMPSHLTIRVPFRNPYGERRKQALERCLLPQESPVACLLPTKEAHVLKKSRWKIFLHVFNFTLKFFFFLF